MPTYRVEHDSLGEVRLPADALYGAQTARAFANFPISGRTAHPALLRALLKIKRACAVANQSSGALGRREAELITRSVDGILALPPTDWPALFPVDPFQAGAGTSQNMNTNEVIANWGGRLAGEALGTYVSLHPNDQVNRSQSTNDVYPTAIRLALLEESALLLPELRLLSWSFSKKAHEWSDYPKSGRTHLMDAVPMSAGDEMGAYASALSRAADWITWAREELRSLPIGGSAVGTGLNVPSGFKARVIEELERLTEEKLAECANPFEGIQSQAPLLLYLSHLKILAVELIRIANDLRLLSSGPMTGLAEIRLPAVQPGSSIMPGKVNPSMLEMLNQVCFAVAGHEQTVMLAAQAGQLELNVMMPVIASHALDATTWLGRAIESARLRCIDGMEADPERMRGFFERTPQAATALTPILGYEATAKLVQDAVTERCSVIALARARGLIDEKQAEALLRRIAA